jgi:hypothetical protein
MSNALSWTWQLSVGDRKRGRDQTKVTAPAAAAAAAAAVAASAALSPCCQPPPAAAKHCPGLCYLPLPVVSAPPRPQLPRVGAIHRERRHAASTLRRPFQGRARWCCCLVIVVAAVVGAPPKVKEMPLLWYIGPSADTSIMATDTSEITHPLQGYRITSDYGIPSARLKVEGADVLRVHHEEEQYWW